MPFVCVEITKNRGRQEDSELGAGVISVQGLLGSREEQHGDRVGEKPREGLEIKRIMIERWRENEGCVEPYGK